MRSEHFLDSEQFKLAESRADAVLFSNALVVPDDFVAFLHETNDPRGDGSRGGALSRTTPEVRLLLRLVLLRGAEDACGRRHSRRAGRLEDIEVGN